MIPVGSTRSVKEVYPVGAVVPVSVTPSLIAV